VVLLTEHEARALLATGRPELAFFAAWAVRHRRGAAAKRIVHEAIALTDHAGDASLRTAQVQAIFNVLDAPLLELFKEIVMNVDTMPESDAFRELRLMIEARGEARMLLQLLAVRGLTVDDEFRARVMACDDRALLERWHARAVTAATLAEVVATER
jgi:hypothetical protein